MIDFRPLTVRGKPIGNGREPAVCVPLMGGDRAALETELQGVSSRPPDAIEWRVDHFRSVGDLAEVLDTAVQIRRLCGDRPLIFTLRSEAEGGARTGLRDAAIVELLERIARSRTVDFIDVELAAPRERTQAIMAAAKPCGVQIIVSSHDFLATPTEEEIFRRLSAAAALGADVAKVAVMPSAMSDVIRLLSATERAHRELSIPLITMAMGSLGMVTRVFGSLFGSALTFAAGAQASAPGQLPFDRLRDILEAVRSRRER